MATTDSPSQSQPDVVRERAVYTITELLGFKDLPHCQQRPEGMKQLPLHSLTKSNVADKSKKNTRTRTSSVKSTKGTGVDEGDVREVSPPGRKAPSKAAPTKSKKSNTATGEYPGVRQMKERGLETSGLTGAQMFELERQQHRAQHLKSKGMDVPNELNQIPETSDFFSSATSSIPFKSLESPRSRPNGGAKETPKGSPFEMPSFFQERSAEAPMASKPLSFGSPGREQSSFSFLSSPPASERAISIPEPSGSLFSGPLSPFGSPASDAGAFGSFGNRQQAGSFESASSMPHSFSFLNSDRMEKMSSARPAEGPYGSAEGVFGVLERRAPPQGHFRRPSPPPPVVDDHNPAPLPSGEALQKANEIGSNLLAMLDRSMQEQATTPSAREEKPSVRGGAPPARGEEARQGTHDKPPPARGMATPLNTSALFGGPNPHGPPAGQSGRLPPHLQMQAPYSIPMGGAPSGFPPPHGGMYPGYPPHGRGMPPQSSVGRGEMSSAQMQQMYMMNMQQRERYGPPQGQAGPYHGQGPPQMYTPQQARGPAAYQQHPPAHQQQSLNPNQPATNALFHSGRMVTLQEIENRGRAPPR